MTAGVCRYLFQVLTVMVDPEAAADVRLEAVFSFTDSLVTVRVELRRGVCLVSRGGGGGGVTEGGAGGGDHGGGVAPAAGRPEVLASSQPRGGGQGEAQPSSGQYILRVLRQGCVDNNEYRDTGMCRYC